MSSPCTVAALLLALASSPLTFAQEPRTGQSSVRMTGEGIPRETGAAPANGPAPSLDLVDEPLFAAPTGRDRIGRIVAPVMINGHGPFRFVVDTGATHSVISSQLALQLGLQVLTADSVRVRGVTGSALVATTHVARLQAGSLVIEDSMMPVLGAVMSGVDGVLGAQGLESKVIVVDFVRDRIQILDSRSNRWRELLRVPVTLGFDRLLLANATVGRVRCKAIIDTGAQHTLGNLALREALRLSSNLRAARATVNIQGVTAEMQTGELTAAPMIRLGNLNLAQVNIAFGDMHVFEVWKLADEPALLVGMDVLGILEMLVIDYGRQEVRFKPRGGLRVTKSSGSRIE
jgi:predicted aspartyl protease